MHTEQQFEIGKRMASINLGIHIGLKPTVRCGQYSNDPTEEYKCRVPLDEDFQLATAAEQLAVLKMCRSLSQPSRHLLRHMSVGALPCFMQVRLPRFVPRRKH